MSVVVLVPIDPVVYGGLGLQSRYAYCCSLFACMACGLCPVEELVQLFLLACSQSIRWTSLVSILLVHRCVLILCLVILIMAVVQF